MLCPRGDYNGLAFKVSAVGDDGLDLSVLTEETSAISMSAPRVSACSTLFGKFVARKGEQIRDVFNLGEKVICPPKVSFSITRTDFPLFFQTAAVSPQGRRR